MKRSLLLLCALLPSFAAAADLVVQNPGFESGLSGWTTTGDAIATNSTVNGGEKALRVLTGGEAAQDITTSVKPGENFRASVWGKTGNKLQPVQMIIRAFDQSGAKISEKAVSIATTDFALHHVDFAVPYSAKQVNLYLSKMAGSYSFGMFDGASLMVDTWSPHKLRWAPPALVNPITIQLTAGQTGTKLDPTKDYIIKFPPTKKVGGTAIFGGRNVVIMGGHVTIPAENTGKGGNYQRSLFITDNQGIVHIEGLLVDGSGGGESDAIAISSPNSTVQIQNLRVNGILGTNNTWHADVVQPWGGVKELRIDRITGSSYYQGLQIPEDVGAIGKAIISHVNLSILTPATGVSGGQMVWLSHYCKGYPVELDEVYALPRPGRTFGSSVFPMNTDTTCPFVINGQEGYWPGLPQKGVVKHGVPEKDFVPEGTAGINYVSPGYNP